MGQKDVRKLENVCFSAGYIKYFTGTYYLNRPPTLKVFTELDLIIQELRQVVFLRLAISWSFIVTGRHCVLYLLMPAVQLCNRAGITNFCFAKK